MYTKSELTAVCIACDKDMAMTQKPRIGNKISCKYCETEYVVVAIDPIELELVMDEDDFDNVNYDDFDDDDDYEDYDDDDDYYDDDDDY